MMKKSLISITAIIGVGTILGVGVSASLINEKNNNKTVLNLKDNRIDPKFAGTRLLNSDIKALGWDIKTTITLADWKKDAPNVTDINWETLSGGKLMGAFEGTTLKSIQIPKTIKILGAYSFNGLRSFNSIIFEGGSQLQSINESCFGGTKITSIDIPASVTYMQPIESDIPYPRKGAFASTPNLVNITMSYDLRLPEPASTPKYGFTQEQWDTINWRYSPYLGEILTSEAVKSIGWEKKSTITLADWKKDAPNVTVIGEQAFHNQPSRKILKSIEIPNSVISIEIEAFLQVSSLNSLTFQSDSKLESIGPKGIEATGIINLSLPPSLKSLGDAAFWGSQSLETVTFATNSKITSIPKYAFARAPKLRELYIPNSVTTIEINSFHSLTTLLGQNIQMPKILRYPNPSNPKYGFTQEQWDTINWRYSPYLGEILTREAVESIGWDKKTTITLDDWKTWAPNVTSIADAAFVSKDVLTSIAIPNKITSIDSSFNGVTSLTEVTFEPNSKLTTIGNQAFSRTKITSINIPSSVTSIGYSSFEGINSLTEVTFERNSKLTTIGNGAFYNTSITSINIPSSVTSIEDNAFEAIHSLTEVTLNQVQN